jgi:peptidyl-prolyl cis-trans isomerase C
MQKGQLFIVNEGENSMINSIADIKDSPVTAKNAAPQIEQYLLNKKTKEVADAEITHLRSMAKIEYLNASAPIAP